MSEQITFENYDKPIDYNLVKLQNRLAGISSVIGIQHRLSERFTLLFRDNFFDLPFSSAPALSIGNWTLHTAYAIRATAKALFLSCTFETMGRLDAVIGTGSEYPGIILVAEWESNAFSVFGVNNELDKLWNGANQHKHADAFLFTYCPIDKFFDFIKQVVEVWQGKELIRSTFPSLFLTVVVFRKISRNHEFIFMRTVEVCSATVKLWFDLGFVNLDEYRNYIEHM